MFAALNTVEPPIMDYSIATIFEADQPWSAQRLPSVEARIDERLGELTRRLGEREWLDGDAFTAGDLLMVAVLRILDGSAMLAKYPPLAAYVARGTARPAFARALADQLAGFTGSPPPQFAAWLEKQKQNQGETQ
jgi:glutathione S-transferase